MRISDWGSDVCSSDLAVDLAASLVGVVFCAQQLDLLAPGFDVFGIVHFLGRGAYKLAPGLRVIEFYTLFQCADACIQYEAFLVAVIRAEDEGMFDQIGLLAFGPLHGRRSWWEKGGQEG